ncbi:MAG TPA: (Fe-S)-binding protein [Egicoccus sp.]|nr:(Fe-S)-binding protein [Egicoccus sp.]HSK23235.1 (Fe-S)-binding protein [Egicoccus sp.]
MNEDLLLTLIRIGGAVALVAVVGALAARRIQFLYGLVRKAQPQPERVTRAAIMGNVKYLFTKILGQQKLLRWSLPGVAHFFVFWSFLVIQTTLIEAAGELIDPTFQIPLLNRIALFGVTAYDLLGFLQDSFMILTILGVAIFAGIRLALDPRRVGRRSRFTGSNLNQGWWVLMGEFLVVWTLLIAHGVRAALDHAPTEAAFLSIRVGSLFEGMDPFALELTSAIMLIVHLAIVGWFLLFTLNSKHLHIATIPFQELFARQPKALGKLRTELIDMETMDEDTVLGVGKIEDFGFKHVLDMYTCTECGRCQSQCPAWNTGKPLSPKMLVMDLRDHLYAKGPFLLGKEDEEQAADVINMQLVGDTPGQENAVIDYDVLWSCTTCGACVEECPVDIEHVDMIMDMRRYKTMMESSFPQEAGIMLRNVENAGDPWGVGQSKREEWTDKLDFDIPVAQPGVELDADTEYLFWVGCAGSVDDRSKKITQATAQLLHDAGVKFAILGKNETCNGDPARRLGMEYLFQMLAAQNVEMLKSIGADKNSPRARGGHLKIVAWCPHCFNTLKNEYPDFDGNFEVLHHSEVLAQLIDDGRLVATKEIEAKITYHDPCYLGRHNEVYSTPRKVVDAVPGLTPTEMGRCRSNGFCCGAGGARMWVEENIGKRVNMERVEEALEMDPDLISTACPFCTTMLSDGIAQKVQDGSLAEGKVEVLDISEVLQRGRLLPMAAQGVKDGEA